MKQKKERSVSKFNLFKSKLSLVWLISISVILIACLTVGVVLAAISRTQSESPPSINAGKVGTQFWDLNNNAVTDLSKLSNSSALYVSASLNGSTNVDPACVLRISSNAIDFEDTWTYQDNGYYYYNGIVGNGGTITRVLVGTVTNNKGSVLADVMQFSDSTNGFVSAWSPLAGRDAKSASLSNAGSVDAPGKTVDNVNFIQVGPSPLFGMYRIRDSNKVQYTATSKQTVVTTDDALLMPLPALPNGQTITISETIGSLDSGYLLFYSNAFLPVIVMLNYELALYERDGDSYELVTSSSPFGYNFSSTATLAHGSAFTAVDTGSRGINVVSNRPIMPGEYVQTLNGASTISLTISSVNKDINEGDYAIRLVVSIDVEDVDSFAEKLIALTDTDPSNDKNLSNYKKYVTAYNANANMHSKYITWLNAIVSAAKTVGLVDSSFAVNDFYTKLSGGGVGGVTYSVQNNNNNVVDDEGDVDNVENTEDAENVESAGGTESVENTETQSI